MRRNRGQPQLIVARSSTTCDSLIAESMGIREAENASECRSVMKMYTPREPGEHISFIHTKPFFVVDNLAELAGPRSGIVKLPVSIDWSADPTHNIDDPKQARIMYEIVLSEALSEATLAQWLNLDLLRQLWPSLRLPRYVRNAWETAHPDLSVQPGVV